MTNDDEVFEPELRLVCPFCKLEVLAGHDGRRAPMLMHTVPACSNFETLEIDDFLVECRRFVEGQKLT